MHRWVPIHTHTCTHAHTHTSIYTRNKSLVPAKQHTQVREAILQDAHSAHTHTHAQVCTKIHTHTHTWILTVCKV